MLTPVVASSNADAHYQGSTAQSARIMPEQAGRTVPQTAIPTDVASSTLARINILSLTGQLQFIHTMSVLAETLSNIVNLPRKPGESAEEHIERLVNRISSLPPAERRVVEAQLNLLLQGATLKTLAEALKNPSGPDAARLAVMLEMSRYKGRDLAAGAAVKSYRQNSGAEVPSPATPVARPAAPATTPSANAQNTPATGQGNSASVIAAALQKASAIATRYIAAQSAALPEAASSMVDAPGTATERNSASHTPGKSSNLTYDDPETGASGEIDSDLSPSPLERLRGAASAAASRDREVLSSATKPQPFDITRADATRDTGRNGDPQHGEDDHDVSDNRRIHADDRDPRLARQIATSITQTTQGSAAAKGDSLTSFLMSVLVPGKISEGAAAAPAASLPSGEELSEQQNARIKTDEMTASTPRGLESAGPENPGTTDARAASANAQQAETARNATMRAEQQGMQAGAMLAAVLGREVIVPLPYVPYLPAKEEPETPAQHRGNAPSGGGEEEAPGEEQQNEMQDEQSADETDASSADEDQDQTGAEPQGAQDFYQRMSDWN